MSEQLRFLIADDEPIARRTIRRLVSDALPDAELAEAGSVAEVRSLLDSERYDVLFLDVDLGDGTGFDALESCAAMTLPVTVFVTAYDEFAIRAFEVEAVDYLLKPFTDTKFAETLDRAIRRLHTDRTASSKRSRYIERICVRKRGRVLYVPVDEITWIESDDYYSRIHTPAGSHLVRLSLKELERSLDPARFSRTHRSAIVQLEMVRSIEDRDGRSVVVLADQTEVPLSRTRRKSFRQSMTRTDE